MGLDGTGFDGTGMAPPTPEELSGAVHGPVSKLDGPCNEFVFSTGLIDRH